MLTYLLMFRIQSRSSVEKQILIYVDLAKPESEASLHKLGLALLSGLRHHVFHVL